MTKRTWTWLSAVAAMLAASGTGLRAQDAPAAPAPPAPPMSDTGTGADATTNATDSTSTTTTSSDSTTTTTSSGSTMNNGTMNNGMSGGTNSSSMSMTSRSPMSSDRPDYSVLLDRDYDYQDLKQAEAVGLGDDNVAKISLISRISAVPFRQIRNAVERGETFYQLANRYSLNLGDIADVSDEKLRIASYLAAYEASGLSGLKRTASASDTQLEASFARFRALNASFPATATPSTLTFERGPAPAVQTTAETTTVRATRTEAVTTETVQAVPVVKTIRTVRRVRTVTRTPKRHTMRRHHAVRMHRHHQVHHHLPRYMHRGS